MVAVNILQLAIALAVLASISVISVGQQIRSYSGQELYPAQIW